MKLEKFIKFKHIINSLSIHKNDKEAIISMLKDIIDNTNNNFIIKVNTENNVHEYNINNKYFVNINKEDGIINDKDLYDYCIHNGICNVVIDLNGSKINAFVNITNSDKIIYCIIAGEKESIITPILVITNK